MKKSLITFALLLSGLTAGAQTYSVRPEMRSVKMNTDTLNTESHIFKAGKALRKSSYYDATSWGLTIASGAFFAGIGDANRKVCNAIGTVLAVGAVATRILSVTMKDKAGHELMLAPGKVTVTF